MRLSCLLCAALLVGCADQAQVGNLQSKVISLEIDRAAHEKRIQDLEDQIQGLEMRLQNAEVSVTAAGEQSAAMPPTLWILWEKETPLTSRYMVGYKPDRPTGAHQSERECARTAADHVSKQAGAEQASLSFVAQGDLYPTRFSYSCLPVGVDPRSRN